MIIVRYGSSTELKCCLPVESPMDPHSDRDPSLQVNLSAPFMHTDGSVRDDDGSGDG